MRDMKLSSISSKNVFQTKIEKTVEKKKKVTSHWRYKELSVSLAQKETN